MTKVLLNQCIAEAAGTFLLVFFGTGALFVAVFTGALQGLMQVAAVWGLAIALAIYATSAISGAHINPAVTVAAALYRNFPWRNVGPYIVAQLIGAFSASALLYGLFSAVIRQFESVRKLIRGTPGSQLSAMVFGEYFPNPDLFGTSSEALSHVTTLQAMVAEGVGTALLVYFVFALTDRHNKNRPDGSFFALFIGLAVAIIIAVIGPLTQAGLNPARDFGPRLFAYLAGWKAIAIPGPRSGFFSVYILAPFLGGIAGGWVYQNVLRPTGLHEDDPATSNAAAKLQPQQ